ncbi:hypothetical protein V8C26DRAFT_79685 [Trichoderma gracile]
MASAKAPLLGSFAYPACLVLAYPLHCTSAGRLFTRRTVSTGLQSSPRGQRIGWRIVGVKLRWQCGIPGVFVASKLRPMRCRVTHTQRHQSTWRCLRPGSATLEVR